MSTHYRHPLARHAAGEVLGYRADGRPIYAIAGGSTPAAPAAPAPAAPAPAAPAPAAPAAVPAVPAAPVAPAAPTAPAVPAAPVTPPAAPAGGDVDVSTLPAPVQKLIGDLRAEAGKSRTVAKQNAAEQATADITQRLAAALGITPAGDTPPDPAALTAQVAELSAQLRTSQVQTAARAEAAAQGAHADRLLNSVAFNAKVAALDPTAADFTAQLTAAITAEVATDPALYRTAPAGPARGGAEFGVPPTERQPASLTDAIAAHYSG